MSPANSGSPSKERTRARRCQKHQHGSVTRLGTKLSQSLRLGGPVSCTSLLFKGKMGLWCLLFAQSWGTVWKRHCTVPRWTCCVLSGSHKSQEKPAPRSAQETHFNCFYREAEKLPGAGMDWAVQMWGLVCGFRKLISTEFYSFPLAPWAL